MALNKTCNATCDLIGYLFCRMPEDTLEVENNVKTKWGKYTVFQYTYTHTEKYCSWDRADRRSSMCTGRRRTPPKGRYIVAMIIQLQRLTFQWEKVSVTPLRSSQTLNLQLRFPTQKGKGR